MREGVEQEEMKEEDLEEDEEELLEEEQLVVKEGRKNLDGGRGGWEWSRRWQQCTASEGRAGGYFIPSNIPLHCWGQCTNMLNERLMKKWTVYYQV